MLGSTCRDSSMGGLMVTRLNCFEVSLSRARLSWHTRHKMSHNVTKCHKMSHHIYLTSVSRRSPSSATVWRLRLRTKLRFCVSR